MAYTHEIEVGREEVELKGAIIHVRLCVDCMVDEDGISYMHVSSGEAYSGRLKAWIPFKKNSAVLDAIQNKYWNDLQGECYDRISDKNAASREERQTVRDYWNSQFSHADMAVMRRGY